MTRQYTMRRRAEQFEETRRRIVDATAALHDELGPARTTVTAIAERAGVSRPTVYKQFPDELSLFSACGALFEERHVFPDIEGVPLEDALRAVYTYYVDNRRMLEHVERDSRLLPALDQVYELSRRRLDHHADVQATRVSGGRDVRAAIRLALDFNTWRCLAKQGLTPSECASLMIRLLA